MFRKAIKVSKIIYVISLTITNSTPNLIFIMNFFHKLIIFTKKCILVSSIKLDSNMLLKKVYFLTQEKIIIDILSIF